MTQYEMTEKLSEKMGVTMEQAKAALEACDWEMLDAALLLEKEKGENREAYTTEQAPRAEEPGKKGDFKGAMKNIGSIIRKVINCGNRNRLVIERKGETIIELPVTVVVLLLIVSFWVTLPLLVVGLFTGFRYSFNGPELGRDSVNSAMDKAAEVAEKVKEEVAGDKVDKAE